MKKRVVFFILPIITLLCFSGCSLVLPAIGELISFGEDAFSFEGESGDIRINDLGEYGTGSTAFSGEYKTLKNSFSDAKTATVMVYINGSDLEEEGGAASEDIEEMLSAKIGGNVNVVIETGGAKKWENEKISEEYTERFILKDGELIKIKGETFSADMTEAETLRDFISYCKDNYPADRNMLILWNHGGGAVEGYGYDTVAANDDALTLDELQTALEGGKTYFDFIGFDACLMSGVETAAALCDYADYLIASEDFESSFGWYYKTWLEELSDDIQIPTVRLGKIIIDSFTEYNEKNDETGILSLTDLSQAGNLFESWFEFLKNNESRFENARFDNGFNISDRARKIKKGIFEDVFNLIFSGEDTLDDYCLADMGDVLKSIGGKGHDELKDSLEKAVIYTGKTDGVSLYGMSAIIPIKSEYTYELMRNAFINCGFPEEYLELLSNISGLSEREGEQLQSWQAS